MEYLSRSEADTETFGTNLAECLTAGTVVALRGGLGMGKTALTRGIARGLGISGRVSSPTFTIVNEYNDGRVPLFHFDWYRIRDAEELYALGWDEYLERNGICVVEWSEQIPEALPPRTVTVTLARAPGYGDNARMICVEGVDMP